MKRKKEEEVEEEEWSQINLNGESSFSLLATIGREEVEKGEWKIYLNLSTDLTGCIDQNPHNQELVVASIVCIEDIVLRM